MRSSAAKSGKARPASAWMMPTVARWGKSRPRARVWVPMRMSISPALTSS